MVCSGYIPAFDLGSDVGDFSPQVFVVAAPEQQVINATGEWLHEFRLAEHLGIIPKDNELAYGKVVGFLTVHRTRDLDPFWNYDCDKHSHVYRIIDAYSYERPFHVSSILHGRPIRSEIYRPSLITVQGFRTLRLPLSWVDFCICNERHTLTLPFTPYLCRYLFFGETRIAYQYLSVVHNNQEKIFKYDPYFEIFRPKNDDGTYQTTFSKILNTPVALPWIVFHLEQQV